MSVHQLPIRRAETRGTIHVWGDRVEGFTVSHESESGNSWSELHEYSTGAEAITAAHILNRDQYGGVCAVFICDAAVEDTSPGVGLVSLPEPL